MSQFHNRAVTELLKTFTKTEIKEFKKYVDYKGGKSVVALWKALQDHHPKYELTDKEIYEAIRPKQAFKDNVYRIWVTELTNLAKEFLATKEFHQDTFLYNNTVSKVMLKRQVKKMGQKVLAKQEQTLKKTAQPNAEYYAHRFQHEDIGYQYVVRFSHRAITDSLQKAVDYLDYSYFVQKLKFLCAIHNRQRIVKEEYIIRMEEQVLDYLDGQPMVDKPLIYLYYLMLRLMRDLDEHEGFFQFLAYFKQYRKDIDPIEGRQLGTVALNFCFWNIHRGHLRFLAPRLEMAKIMVEEGFVQIRGQMPVYHFRNLVNIAIAADALDWASDFVVTWLPKVKKEHRPYLEAFNRAYLHFARGEYKAQATWMLRMEAEDFTFLDVQDEIAFRMLKLKTAYKQLDPLPKQLANDAFSAQLEAFRNFLNRKKTIPEKARASAKNFQKALKQLHQRKLGKALKVGDLREYMLGLQPLRELPWLLGEL